MLLKSIVLDLVENSKGYSSHKRHLEAGLSATAIIFPASKSFGKSNKDSFAKLVAYFAKFSS